MIKIQNVPNFIFRRELLAWIICQDLSSHSFWEDNLLICNSCPILVLGLVNIASCDQNVWQIQKPSCNPFSIWTSRLEDWKIIIPKTKVSINRYTSLLQQLNLQPLAKCRGDRRLKVFSQYHHGNQAILLKYIKKAEYSSARRHQHQYFLPQTNTDHCRRSFFIRTSKEWNVLPASSPLLSAAPA